MRTRFLLASMPRTIALAASSGNRRYLPEAFAGLPIFFDPGRGAGARRLRNTRRDTGGMNTGDFHPGRAKLFTQALAEASHSELAGAVSGLARRPDQAKHAGHVHDVCVSCALE